MLTLADKKTLFQDRYQAMLLPVPTSGVLRQRHLQQVQRLYPQFYADYQRACARTELTLGQVLHHRPERDLAGLSVGTALYKPSVISALAVTEFAENLPHYQALEQALQTLSPVLFRWARYQGIRRVAMLASDELMLPADKDFDQDILPLLAKYLQPVSTLNLVLYR